MSSPRVLSPTPSPVMATKSRFHRCKMQNIELWSPSGAPFCIPLRCLLGRCRPKRFVLRDPHRSPVRVNRACHLRYIAATHRLGAVSLGGIQGWVSQRRE
jgi:hypothetical protein